MVNLSSDAHQPLHHVSWTGHTSCGFCQSVILTPLLLFLIWSHQLITLCITRELRA
jgi:hypothetical protein